MKTEKTTKKPVAFILQGGIGTGHRLQGIPVLNELLAGLAGDYDLHVYQLSEADEKFKTENYSLKAYPYKNNSGWLIGLWLLWNFIRDNRKKKFTLIHAIRAYPAGYLAVKLGKMFGIRSLVSFQGGDATYIPHIAFGAMKKYKKQIAFVCKEATEISVLTWFHENELRKQLNLERNIHVIPYGVDPEQFYAGKTKSIGQPLQLLHIADINPVKDQDTLLKSFRLMCEKKDCRLTIAGVDTLQRKIHLLSAEMGIADKIHFTGAMSRKELPALLNRSDMLLHTSLYEGQAVVVNESLACGVPVIGTRTGLIADLEGDCILAVAAQDAVALAEKVLWLAEQPDEYNRLRARGLEWTKAHTLQHTLAAFRVLYKQTVTREEIS